MAAEVNKLKLDNGLTLLLKEIHTAPIISHWVWYRVGSRDEIPGSTGISHWVEHMQFKGSQQFPAGELDKAISRDGGVWNAMTYLDWTTYFETMPAEKIDLSLRLEADRMYNSLFVESEVESERTVIISEREGNENSPLFRLDEAVQGAAYRVHAYRHEVIGEMADLESIQRDQLYEHYQNYYTPSNAVLTMAGDFDSGQMIERLRQLYVSLPAGKKPARRSSSEPPQAEERRLQIEGPGETAFIKACYRAPQASHPDFFPFSVLESLLTGPSSLNLFGGGISNKTSRLYRALIESELAVSVDGSLQATIDPFLFGITVTVHPHRQPDQVISVLDHEIDRMFQQPPSAEDLARAVKQARALFAYGSESITNQAFWLGFAEMFADYSWFESYLDRLAEVTPADVQRIAQTYLTPQNRTLGIYLPNGSQEAAF